MNKFLFLIFITTLVGCQTPKTKQEFKLVNEFDSVSYAMGLNYGKMLESQRLDSIDGDVLVQGLDDYFNKSQKFDNSVGAKLVNDYLFKKDSDKSKKMVNDNLAWLEENQKKTGMLVTSSGLQYKIENPGSDLKPDNNDNVTVIYSGFLKDGSEFDSNVGSTSTFSMADGLIVGMQEGLQMIGEGGKIKLVIPHDLAYGPRRGPGDRLPPYSILLFNVELVSVEKVD